MTNAERQKKHRERQKSLREANAVTKKGGSVTKTVTEGSKTVTVVTPQEMVWDREKYPVHRAWVIALERVERARKYAQMFPTFIHQGDLKFQDLDWQYEHEGIPSSKQPEVKEKRESD